MTDALLRLAVLLAIFASVFLLIQFGLDALWRRGAHTRAVNKRMTMIRQGSQREEIYAELRKNAPQSFDTLPGLIARPMRALQRNIMIAGLPITATQAAFISLAGFAVLTAVILFGAVSAGFAIEGGTLVLAMTLALCAAIFVPVMVISAIAQRRRKRIQEQFPVALDVFVRALRAGHPIAAAIELLTTELEDPIGSEFGLVADEVAYGAELTTALEAMAERWDLDDMRMFVVSLSVQSETGGNLAEILQNLSEVIRARASLYMKVRALSSEGRMTGWMLTALPIVTFLGMFSVNPDFYFSTSDDPMFLTGFIALALMYVTGFIMIRRMIDLKV